jgi:hypothetical protein
VAWRVEIGGQLTAGITAVSVGVARQVRNDHRALPRSSG